MVELLNEIIESYKNDIIRDTQKLVSFNSVYEESSRPGQPFGPRIAEALECALEIGAGMGFVTRNVDGYMGEVDYGTKGKKIGIITHIDVVPAGDGWTYPPFEGRVVDGKLYGRGALDDKGPLVASLYAMKAIKESGLPLKNHVRCLIGCDEESGMRCAKYYLSKVEQPWGGFSPDGEFPVIFGEKGIYRFKCSGEWGQPESEYRFSIIKIEGGSRMNVVPDKAVAVLRGDASLFAFAEQALRDFNPKDRITLEQKGENLTITVRGVSAHAAMPWQGVSANNILLNFLHQLPLTPPAAEQYIYALADLFADGHEGKNLGIACSNEEFGQLTISLGVLNVDSKGGSASFDLRYPNLDQREALWQKISEVCETRSLKLLLLQDKPGLYVPQDSELVQCLLKAYQETSGRKEGPKTFGGGTYSRTMKNFVAFGPVFPWQKEMAHERDEYISIEDLILCAKIYAQALYSLMK
ncbi:MAG: dipeptidase PepV [Clostridiaceae bacterium]|nr:dipeptidase PepV [Clostridiaceae bacterium]